MLARVIDASAVRVVGIPVSGSGFKNFTYLLFDEESREGALIDPAWEPDAIAALIASHRVQVRSVLLTHSHRDHTDLAGWASDLYGAQVRINELESQMLGDVRAVPFAATGGEVCRLGSATVMAVPTPGHTRGSTTYFVGEAAFTGDFLYIEGCGICVEPGGDAERMWASVMATSRWEPETRIYPGHQFLAPPGLPLREVRDRNIYTHLTDRDAFVRFRTRPASGGGGAFTLSHGFQHRVGTGVRS